MDQETIIRYVTDTFTDVEVTRPIDGPGAGDTFFSYASPRNKNQLPFATIVTKDYAGWDEASRLDRPDVFRLNVGVSRETFRSQFGAPPAAEGGASGAGGASATDGADDTYDYAALDRLMPHPTYASQSWVCVLNPSVETFEAVKPLLAEAHAVAAARYGGREARSD